MSKHKIFIGTLYREKKNKELDTFLRTGGNVKLFYGDNNIVLVENTNNKIYKEAQDSDSMIFYFDYDISYELICEAMFYLGLGKKMCIIWDKKSKGGIDVKSERDIFCIDEDKLKNL